MQSPTNKDYILYLNHLNPHCIFPICFRLYYLKLNMLTHGCSEIDHNEFIYSVFEKMDNPDHYKWCYIFNKIFQKNSKNVIDLE